MNKSDQIKEFKGVFCEFKSGVTKGRPYLKEFSITDINVIIKYSVALSYRDIQRALHNIANFEKEKQSAIERLEKTLQNYFTAPPVGELVFNKWHKSTCDEIMASFSEYKRGNKSGFTYGCAQKLINLAFKYIYCFDLIQKQYDKYSDYFRFCHIALDNGILKWLEMPQGVTYINDYDLYMCMQKKARSKKLSVLPDDSELFPLEKEFMIYAYMNKENQ